MKFVNKSFRESLHMDIYIQDDNTGYFISVHNTVENSYISDMVLCIYDLRCFFSFYLDTDLDSESLEDRCAANLSRNSWR